MKLYLSKENVLLKSWLYCSTDFRIREYSGSNFDVATQICVSWMHKMSKKNPRPLPKIFTHLCQHNMAKQEKKTKTDLFGSHTCLSRESMPFSREHFQIFSNNILCYRKNLRQRAFSRNIWSRSGWRGEKWDKKYSTLDQSREKKYSSMREREKENSLHTIWLSRLP